MLSNKPAEATTYQQALNREHHQVSGCISGEPFYDTTDTIYITADTCYQDEAVTYRFLADGYYIDSPTTVFLIDACVTCDSLLAVQKLIAQKLGPNVRITRYWLGQEPPF